MNKLDQAIVHAREQAEKLVTDRKCANEHTQLAEWLEELRDRRLTDGYQPAQ